MLMKLHDYNDSQAFPMFRLYPENATLADPDQFGGFWSPWENAIGFNDEIEENVLAKDGGIVGMFRSETMISPNSFLGVSALVMITLLYYYWISRLRKYKKIGDVDSSTFV